MHHKMKLINANNNLIDEIKKEPKNIVQLINAKYKNSFKNPFSNLMLRKIMVHYKIKNLNLMKKGLIKLKQENNENNKKKVFKQNNLYINFSDYFEQNKYNKNENNNEGNIINHNNIYTKIGNSFDENNAFKIFRTKDLSSIRKFYKNRNIRPLKLIPPNRTINNLKITSYSKENSEKEIAYINNKLVKINKMNITINNVPKLIQLNEKIIQTTRQLLPKIEDNIIHNIFNSRNKNTLFRNNNTNNSNITNNINQDKTDKASGYKKNSPKRAFKNRTKNDIIKISDDPYKSISAERFSNNNDIDNHHIQRKKIMNLWKSIKNEGGAVNNSFSNNIHKSKISRINIFKLLSIRHKK